MATFKSMRAVARHLSRLEGSTAITSRSATAVRQPLNKPCICTTSPITATTAFSPRKHRLFSSSAATRREASTSGPSDSEIPPPKSYTFAEIQDLSSSPEPNRILIDVREPSELFQTGRIPGAQSMPISSAPDAVFLSPEDFEDKFGFARPGPDDEVIFYCKAGVRSRQAALLAGQARPMFGGKIANYNGSWLDWEKNGGKIEKEGGQ